MARSTPKMIFFDVYASFLKETRVHTWIALYYIRVSLKYATLCIATHIYLLVYATVVFATCVRLLKCQKNTYFEIQVVWVVMQLTPSVVTTLSSTQLFINHINIGREVHERGLESLHCYFGGIGTLFSHTFSLEAFSLCCKAWRLSSLEKRSSGTK